MEKYGKFGPLLGVIQVNKIYAKFLVFAARNAEILTYSELELKQITPHPSWLEYDPQEIIKSVKQCIEIACQNLVILEINPVDIVAIGLTTQRGTTVLWDKVTGDPLYNAISWSDGRSTEILKGILGKVKGNLNYLKSVCGLPLSTCFSALKVKWLEENVPAVQQCVEKRNCHFGTLDSWILWNLTGSTDNGVHVTDVTNAGYTMLMNLETQQWDKKLCSFFNLPKVIVPEIRSNSEIYGYVQSGSLRGIPISSSIGDQPASLLGQLCTNVGQSLCTIDESCFLLLNTGQEIIDSENGLCSVAAFKLGEKGKCVYALEGAISNAGASLTWLKDTLQINTEINQNENTAEVLSTFLGENSMISSACSSMGNLVASNGDGNSSRKGELIFVPAFNGLYSPYWKYDARGLLLGLTCNTTSEHVTQAAYEATGFQIKEIINSLVIDSPVWAPTKKLTVVGDHAENNPFMQFISDIIGIQIERPQSSSSSCLGAMLAAGIAMNVVTIESAKHILTPPCDSFYPTTTPNRREILYRRWNYAVTKCLNWNNFATFTEDVEDFNRREKDANLPIRQSIPCSIFLTSAFALFLIARYLQTQNIR